MVEYSLANPGGRSGMKTRDATEAALKVLGVYGIVEAALKIPNLACLLYAKFSQAEAGMEEAYRQMQVQQSQNRVLVNQSGQVAVYLAGGVLVLWYARRIADWLVRDDEAISPPEVELKLLSPEGFRFCLKLIGVYALFRACGTAGAGWRTRAMGTDVAKPVGFVPFLLPLLPGALVLGLAMYLLRGGEWVTRFALGRDGRISAK